MNEHTIASDAALRAELAELLPAPQEREIPYERAELMKSVLLREFAETADTAAQARVRRRKRLAWRLGVPAAVVAAVGGTAAVVFINDAPVKPRWPQQTSCSSAYTDSPQFLVGARINGGQTPEEACAALWGMIADTAARSGAPVADVPPPLFSCTYRKGGDLWVMPLPNDRTPQDACTAIGMGVPDDSALYHGATVDQVRRLNDLLNGPGLSELRCEPTPVVRAAAEQALAAVGVTTWKVELALESGEDPNLAVPFVDPDNGLIRLGNSGMTEICAQKAPGG